MHDTDRATLYKTAILCILSVLMVLASCDNRSTFNKQFVWDDEVAELTGRSLYTWLRKAPFDPPFDKYENQDSGKIVITNEKQVFPFMGRYYSNVEELGKDHLTEQDTAIYQDYHILYRDSVWGDLFVSATLLYDDQEVFLNNRYLSWGNPLFDGLGKVTDTYAANLYETSVFAKQPGYKAGLYWVQANFATYLLGFHQRGQLVFETIVPLLRSDTLATLDQMKAVNLDLGLDIPEWENATTAQLQRVDKPESFWKDPFDKIYRSGVYLKIKDTPFTQDNKARKGDYSFSYRSGGGEVSLYTLLQKTDMDIEGFNKANRKMNRYRYRYNDIFYEQHPKDGYVSGTAKTYFKDNQYLEIHFSYPENDMKAKTQVHSVLRYVKTLK